MDSRNLEGASVFSLFKDLIRNIRALGLAVRAYRTKEARSAREEVKDMFEESSQAARVILLSALASQRPGQSKGGLKAVDRCYERWSGASRDLLFAVLRVLRRRP